MSNKIIRRDSLNFLSFVHAKKSAKDDNLLYEIRIKITEIIFSKHNILSIVLEHKIITRCPN